MYSGRGICRKSFYCGYALEIGVLLAAEYMVFGTVGRSGDGYIVSLKNMNIESSRIEAAAIKTLDDFSLDQLSRTAIAMAYELAGIPLN